MISDLFIHHEHASHRVDVMTQETQVYHRVVNIIYKKYTSIHDDIMLYHLIRYYISPK